MSDAALRSLERAVAAGDAVARVPLASAYLRQGRPGAALAVLDDARGAEATAVHEAAWRRGLAALGPAATIPGARLAMDLGPRVVGWFGPAPRADRFVALAAATPAHATSRVVDLDRGDVVAEALPPDHVPAATASHALFCWHGRQLVRVEPPLAEAGPWRIGSTYAVRPYGEVAADPGGGRLLTRFQEAPAVVTWPDLEIVVTAGTARSLALVDWARGRAIVWQEQHGAGPGPGTVRLAPLQRGVLAPPRLLDLRSLGLDPGRPATFELLDDGRLLVGPPLVVVDLDAGAAAAPTLPAAAGAAARAAGPVRLARDRQALLVLLDGRPARAPLVEGGRPTLRLGPPRPGACWHPTADVVASTPIDRGLPEVRGLEGESVRLLPRDAEPLGWSPDGRTLLVVRRHRPARGVLEPWRVPAAALGAEARA